MATFKNLDLVQYGVSDTIKAPLSRLYFCRHCLKLRSSDCVSHEVDSHYCPNCLENMPSAEAILKCNRCTNCFDCPSCQHTLSTRASSVVLPDPDNPEAKPTPKKVYYLSCGVCRWTSRDVGIPDQPIASGGWQNQENPHSKRISTLLNYYRQLAAQEKADKEKKKFIRRRNYLHLADKYGMSTLSARKKAGTLGMSAMSLKDSDDSALPDVDAPPTVDSFDPLPPEIFTQPMKLTDECLLPQRLSTPEHQCSQSRDLYPAHKHLLIKMSARCRQCEHNLSKPEFNPSSIKFKIQLVAIHHVPEIKLMSPPHLQLDRACPVVMTMLNPLDITTHVTLTECTHKDDWSNAKVSLPSCELVLSPRDDAAEFDDHSDQPTGFKDDPGVVVFRKANKLGFVIKVIPLLTDEEVKIAFQMKYNYRNTALMTDNKTPEIVWLTHTLYLTLGKVQ